LYIAASAKLVQCRCLKINLSPTILPAKRQSQPSNRTVDTITADFNVPPGSKLITVNMCQSQLQLRLNKGIVFLRQPFIIFHTQRCRICIIITVISSDTVGFNIALDPAMFQNYIHVIAAFCMSGSIQCQCRHLIFTTANTIPDIPLTVFQCRSANPISGSAFFRTKRHIITKLISLIIFSKTITFQTPAIHTCPYSCVDIFTQLTQTTSQTVVAGNNKRINTSPDLPQCFNILRNITCLQTFQIPFNTAVHLIRKLGFIIINTAAISILCRKCIITAGIIHQQQMQILTDITACIFDLDIVMNSTSWSTTCNIHFVTLIRMNICSQNKCSTATRKTIRPQVLITGCLCHIQHSPVFKYQTTQLTVSSQIP